MIIRVRSLIDDMVCLEEVCQQSQQEYSVERIYILKTRSKILHFRSLIMYQHTNLITHDTIMWSGFWYINALTNSVQN